MPHAELRDYSLGDLAYVEGMDALLRAEADSVFFPEGRPDTFPAWPGAPDTPYVVVLRNAVIYPKPSLDTVPRAELGVATPKTLGRKDLHLVTSEMGGLLPDGFGKSHFVPTNLRREGAEWRGAVPAVRDRLKGTHLFAEMVYGHFGHALVDMPTRLWPLATAGLDVRSLDGIVALPMLGVTPKGGMPRHTVQMIEAMGVPQGMLRFPHRPVRVDRLLIARRAAPYLGRMDAAYNAVMQAAGRRLAAKSDLGGDLPERLYLSRSRLKDDPRGSPELATLDQVFRDMGFEVVHPQTLQLCDQAALVRNARHVAGPVGSQLHLCAFSETEGLNVFSIGPDYFTLPINGRILSALGGRETHFLLPCKRPPPPRDRAPWRFDPNEIPRLRREVAAWLEGVEARV